MVFFALLTTWGNAISSPGRNHQGSMRIVFVHTSIPGSCGPLPEVFKEALIQAKRTQSNTTEVVLLSNFKQCRWALADLHDGDEVFKSIKIVESMGIKSSRTQEFEKKIKKMIPKTDDENLLASSLFRFFMLEDYMHNHSVTTALHIESDTILYEDLSSISFQLQSQYPTLAALPSVHKRFVSASTFWIGNVTSLHGLTDFLLTMSRNDSVIFPRYVSWLREFACCKAADQGGLFPDETGKGVKPWAFSDMTLLAFYRHLNHYEIKFLPLLPHLNHRQELSSVALSTHSATHGGSDPPAIPSSLSHHHQKHHFNLSHYSLGGVEGGFDMGVIFDGGKGGWGGHLVSTQSDSVTAAAGGSGTSSSGGSGGVGSSVSAGSGVVGAAGTGLVGSSGVGGLEAASVATRHIVEQAVQRYNCSVHMRCLPTVTRPAAPAHSSSTAATTNLRTPNLGAGGGGNLKVCVRRPAVACGAGGGGVKWTPMWTLHAGHGSALDAFKSEPCECGK